MYLSRVCPTLQKLLLCRGTLLVESETVTRPKERCLQVWARNPHDGVARTTRQVMSAPRQRMAIPKKVLPSVQHQTAQIVCRACTSIVLDICWVCKPSMRTLFYDYELQFTFSAAKWKIHCILLPSACLACFASMDGIGRRAVKRKKSPPRAVRTLPPVRCQIGSNSRSKSGMMAASFSRHSPCSGTRKHQQPCSSTSQAKPSQYNSSFPSSSLSTSTNPFFHRQDPSPKRVAGSIARRNSFLPMLGMLGIVFITHLLEPARGLVIEEPFQASFDHV